MKLRMLSVEQASSRQRRLSNRRVPSPDIGTYLMLRCTKQYAKQTNALMAEPMAIEKEHKEFFAVDLKDGWVAVPGYPPGIHHKILAGSLDEAGKRGNRTRLLRIGPGVFTTKPFLHEYWEELYLISGDLIVANDENGHNGQQ